MTARDWLGADGNLSNNANYDPVGPVGASDVITNTGVGVNPASGTVTCASWDNGGGDIDGGTFNCNVTNTGTVNNGTVNGTVRAGFFSNGTFNGVVSTAGTIAGGIFNATAVLTDSGAVVNGGTFNAPVDNSTRASVQNGNFKKGVIYASSTVYGVDNLPASPLFPVTSPVASPAA